MDERSALDQVVDCDVHEAYRVELIYTEDVDWDTNVAADADAALAAWIDAEDPGLVSLLKFERTKEHRYQVDYAGAFDDGTVHASVTVSADYEGAKWAVTNCAICTLEELPESEPEEDDDEGTGIDEADLFEN